MMGAALVPKRRKARARLEEYIRNKECTRKRRYETREEALAMLPALPGQHVYRCRFCHLWHTGHYPNTRE